MKYSAKGLYQNLFGGVFFLLLTLVFCVKSEEMRDVCSTGCVCKANYMDCRSNSLEYPNVTLTRVAQNLDLSYNEMRTLNNLSFPDTFATLRSLNLSKNYIESIDEGAFSKLISIQVIDLSHNRIQDIEDSLIKRNANLETLILDFNALIIRPNKLIIRPNNPLLYSQSLKKLSMRLSGITWLDATSFSALPLLEQLDLSLNRLSIIDSNAFSSLPELQWLDLSENMWTCEASLSQMVAKLTNQGVDVKLEDCNTNDSPKKQTSLQIPVQHLAEAVLREQILRDAEMQSEVLFNGSKIAEICELDHMTLCMAYENCLDNYSLFKKIVKYEQSKLFTKSKCIIFAVGVAFGALVGLIMFGIISTCIDKRYGNYKYLSPTSSVSESGQAITPTSAISSKPLV